MPGAESAVFSHSGSGRLPADAASDSSTDPFRARLNGFSAEIGNYGTYSVIFLESATVREQGVVDVTADEGGNT